MSPIPLLLLSTLAIVTSLYFHSTLHTNNPPNNHHILLFNQWQCRYRKLYATPSEVQWRVKVFSENSELIERKNREYVEYAKRLGRVLSGPMFEINKFADMEYGEFVKKYTGLKFKGEQEISEGNGKIARIDRISTKRLTSEDPNSKTLRQEPQFEIRVRNQYTCGGCWAFTAIASAEKEHFLYTGQQLDLSQQELIDCSTENIGCQGGYLFEAFKYIKLNGVGFASEYPYYSAVSTCNIKEPKVKFPKTFVPQVLQFTLDAAKELTEAGVFVGTSISGYNAFMFVSQSDDIFDLRSQPECHSQSNHAVTIIEAKDNYLTILNSWGENWGNNGLKKVIPCGETFLLGYPSQLSHPRLLTD